MFQYPFQININTCKVILASPDSCNQIPILLRPRTLFLAPSEMLKNYYPLSYGDYLGEPFNREDFEYRISALCYRMNSTPYIKRYRFLFSHMEYELLSRLNEEPGKIYSSNELISYLSCDNINSLRQLIYNIRKKLNRLSGFSENGIRTIKNIGYQWVN